MEITLKIQSSLGHTVTEETREVYVLNMVDFFKYFETLLKTLETKELGETEYLYLDAETLKAGTMLEEDMAYVLTQYYDIN